MRLAVMTGLLLLITSAPAAATQGMRCAPVSGAGPVITMSIGQQLLDVHLEDGRTRLTTRGPNQRSTTQPMTIGQSWIDARYLWVDLLDANADRYEGRLRATFQPRQRGRPAVGTFVRNGRTWRVRCVEA